MNRTWVVAIIGLLTAGCHGDVTPVADAAVLVDQSPGAQLAAGPANARVAQRRTAITDAVQRIAPSVVTVQTEVVQHETDAFGQFFGGRP